MEDKGFMKNITLEELLEAGCHFGHQVTRQNPKARDFVFESRDNIHIIDLAKTKEGLDEAMQVVFDIAKRNGNLLIVGTKRQAQNIVTEEIAKVQETLKEKGIEPGLYSITKRWIGGILTNADALKKNYEKLRHLTEMLVSEEEKAPYTKKELGLFEKERQKLESFYSGIKTMKQQPDALFIIDTHLEHLAVAEALRMSVPTVGIVDTNADPEVVTYPIPANDDAVGSLKLIVGAILDAWFEGKKASAKVEKEEKKEAPRSTDLMQVKEVPAEVKEVKKTKEKPAKKEKAKKTPAKSSTAKKK
ncbi:MAG: 30S ribosomal protein S2 [Candidatus Levyibacteriota bacterium]